jgi:Fe-S cluster assembly ATP-binding protein
MALVIITHHERLLEFNRPQHTHVMLAGRIVEHGDARLAHELHDQGYAGVRARHPEEAAEEREEAQARQAQAQPAVVKAQE